MKMKKPVVFARYFPLSILLLGILLTSGTFVTMTHDVKALPNEPPITNTQSLNDNNSNAALMQNNSTLVANIDGNSASATTKISSAIGASSISQYSTNATYSPPLATIRTPRAPPMMIPSPEYPNSGSDNQGISPMFTRQWYIMDIWSTSSGQNMPNYMCGTLTALANTITGMQAGNDYICYIPINVAYGASANNFIWFQFGVIFNQDGTAAFQFDYYYNATGNQITPPGLMPYTFGDTYDFVIQPTDSNTVTFTMTVHGGSYNPWIVPVTVPGIQMLHYPGAGFSPCSCIEGYTEDSVANIPYMQTYLGYGETSHYHIYAGPQSPASGIFSGVWTADSNDYYWSMCGANDIASINQGYGQGYGPIGNGGVSNPPSAVIGTRDGNYAYIYGGNPGDGGYIKAQMNALSGGNIYVYCYSSSGYYSDLYVYVSNDDQNWIQIDNTPVQVNPSAHKWIEVGNPYMADFQYISIVGYDDVNHGMLSVYLHIDAIVVGSTDPNVTILAYDESSGSYVNGIPIFVDGDLVASGNTVFETPQDHIFQAPDSDGGGAFNAFFDGSNWYGNSADITISQDTTITAYYYYIPTYTLTVTAEDQYGYGAVPVGVDGNLVGYTPLSIPISLGFHSIAVPGSSGYLQFLDLQDLTNGQYYQDGDSIAITSDTTINAQYLYW